MSRLKDLQPLPKLRVGNANGGAQPFAMHSLSAMPATERSLPGSPNSAMSMADADMSVMSASDLTSIGFDSTVDCDTADIIAETPVRGGGGARGGANRRADGDAGNGGGGGDAAGAGADVLTGMLRAPIQRGLLLIIDFMKAQGGGANANAARSRSSRQLQVLLARCSEMATLALKRDVLSRAAALRALIARIPAMVSRREFGGVLSELQVC